MAAKKGVRGRRRGPRPRRGHFRAAKGGVAWVKASPLEEGAPRWKVSYTVGGRKRTVRRFRTEPEAREFYMGLYRRSSPPHEQAIEMDRARKR